MEIMERSLSAFKLEVGLASSLTEFFPFLSTASRSAFRSLMILPSQQYWRSGSLSGYLLFISWSICAREVIPCDSLNSFSPSCTLTVTDIQQFMPIHFLLTIKRGRIYYILIGPYYSLPKSKNIGISNATLPFIPFHMIFSLYNTQSNMGGTASSKQRVGSPSQPLDLSTLDEQARGVIARVRAKVQRCHDAPLLECRCQVVSGMMYLLTFLVDGKHETFRVWSQPWLKLLQVEFEDKGKMAI